MTVKLSRTKGEPAISIDLAVEGSAARKPWSVPAITQRDVLESVAGSCDPGVAKGVGEPGFCQTNTFS